MEPRLIEKLREAERGFYVQFPDDVVKSLMDDFIAGPVAPLTRVVLFEKTYNYRQLNIFLMDIAKRLGFFPTDGINISGEVTQDELLYILDYINIIRRQTERI